MGVWSDFIGTVEGWYGFNNKPTIAIGADVSGNLVFKDEVVVGTKTLTELLAGGVAFDEDTILVNADGDVLTNEDGNVLLSG